MNSVQIQPPLVQSSESLPLPKNCPFTLTCRPHLAGNRSHKPATSQDPAPPTSGHVTTLLQPIKLVEKRHCLVISSWQRTARIPIPSLTPRILPPTVLADPIPLSRRPRGRLVVAVPATLQGPASGAFIVEQYHRRCKFDVRTWTAFPFLLGDWTIGAGLAAAVAAKYPSSLIGADGACWSGSGSGWLFCAIIGRFSFRCKVRLSTPPAGLRLLANRSTIARRAFFYALNGSAALPPVLRIKSRSLFVSIVVYLMRVITSGCVDNGGGTTQRSMAEQRGTTAHLQRRDLLRNLEQQTHAKASGKLETSGDL